MELPNNSAFFVVHRNFLTVQITLHILKPNHVAIQSLQLGPRLVKLYFHLQSMRFKWQLVPKCLFLLILDVEHKLFREGILQVQFLVHYGRLVHLQSSARHAVSNQIFRRRLQNVDECDSIGYFHLDGKNAIHCRI